MANRNAPGPIGILNGQQGSSMAFRNPQWRIALLNAPEKSSADERNRQSPRGIFSGLEVSSMAYRNPQWPIGNVNCL